MDSVKTTVLQNPTVILLKSHGKKITKLGVLYIEHNIPGSIEIQTSFLLPEKMDCWIFFKIFLVYFQILWFRTFWFRVLKSTSYKFKIFQTSLGMLHLILLDFLNRVEWYGSRIRIFHGISNILHVFPDPEPA